MGHLCELLEKRCFRWAGFSLWTTAIVEWLVSLGACCWRQPQSLDLASSAPPSTAQHRRRRRRSRWLIEALGGMDCSEGSAGAVAGGLPEDALVEILSRVPAKSVCRFRCVSKAWRGLIDDPLNRRKLPQTLEGFFVADGPTRRIDGDVGRLDFISFLPRSVPLDIDRRFSFLTTKLLPETEALVFGDCCNGLLLLEHSWKGQPVDTLGGYIVCNPATKHWVSVPPCSCCEPSARNEYRNTFLAFDPAVSPHFHLIQLWKMPLDPRSSVHAYSSETGLWSRHDQTELEGWHCDGRLNQVTSQRAFVNGNLHLIALWGSTSDGCCGCTWEDKKENRNAS